MARTKGTAKSHRGLLQVNKSAIDLTKVMIKLANRWDFYNICWL